jgi:hypothetical protein
MCEWTRILVVDSGQEGEKVTKAFLWYGNKTSCQLFELLILNKIGIVISMLMTTIHLSSTTNAKLYYLSMNTQN